MSCGESCGSRTAQYLHGISLNPHLAHSHLKFAFRVSTTTNMSLHADLIAPNGRQIKLPTGLFINNEFVAATGGRKISSINPA